MTLDQLKNLIYHKAKISSAETSEVNIVTSVIAEVINDVCKRYFWSFLEEKDDSSITLSAGEYQKELPSDFLHLKGVVLKDADNITYPVFSEKELEVYRGKPDLDDTGRPYLRWVYWDSANKYYLQFHPKSDGSYTVLLRYLQKLNEDEIGRIPNGLVIFFGCMRVLASPDEMAKYDTMYENGILRMWDSDDSDLEAEPELGLDEAIKQFNQYMAGI